MTTRVWPRCFPMMLVGVCLATTVEAQWHKDGVPVCTFAGSQRSPYTAPDGAGGVIVVWEDDRTSPGRIFAQRLDACGVPQWPADGVVVCAGDVGRAFPVAVSDGLGGAIIAWEDGRNQSTTGNDVYAQRIDASGAPLWLSNGVALCTASNSQEHPAIISDNRNSPVVGGTPGAIIVWKDERNSGVDDPQTDIYAQAVDASGNVRWTANGVGVCTAGAIQTVPALVTDGIGLITAPKGAIIAWEDQRSGPPQIFAQRLNSSGVPQWTANGVAVCTFYASSPHLAFAGSGSAIISWQDQRSGDSDIYAQRVAGAGVAQWAANGIPICTAANAQSATSILGDGSGGAIMGWEDPRGLPNDDFYAQRVDANGSALWMPDGVSLCGQPGRRYALTMVTDLAGGAIAAWTDLRSGTDYDIYAQHVNASGVVQWNPGGVPVSSAAPQIVPSMITDGAGGAIMAWTDLRDFGTLSHDIYAARIASGGQILGVDPGEAPGPRVLFPFPNPTSGAVALSFELRSAERVTAQIFGVDGRLIRRLARGEEFAAGLQTLRWDGRDGDRVPVSAGIYFVRVRVGEEATARKIFVMR